jgi:hypothetical protein
MRKTQQPLAAGNLHKEKDLNRSSMRCYALNWLLDGRLSQNTVKLLENKPIARALFPR